MIKMITISPTKPRVTPVVSSPAPSSPPLKYDAFLSFRAEDTLFFASHLVSGLLKKQLEIFFDIHNLIEMEEKDDTIAPEGACLAAIDQSLVSIVILSEKYASSTWCLTELSRILESRRNYGQRVIPVFYKVDPSHVRYQIGGFGDAFHKHEDDLMKVLDLKKVKSDLEEISNISGYDSRFIGSSDSEVVNDVVNKISRWRAGKDVVEIELASVEEKLISQWRRMKSMIQGMAKLDYGDDQPISALRLHEHQWYLAFLRFYIEGNLRSRRVRPSFFDSMCALQSLTLSGTSIKYLPESVFGLAYLRVFFAEDCQLCELPENPRNPLLEFLFLRRNWALRKIPPSFFDGMQAVKCLDLSMTGIKVLPVSSLSLPTLKQLWLSHCELCKLPENPNWPVLEGLYLDGNHDLRTIPPSFFDCMPALQMLDLSMTGIKSLPNSPFSLPELRSLFLIDCQLCKLPENMMCPELQNLSLRGNRQLRMIPPSFFKNMPALFYLCLSKTPIKHLPDSFFCLKQLEVLHLRDCDLLMTLSRRIGELKCLKDLDLEGTEIMHLPEEVKELKHLKALRVSFCELPSYIREKHSEQVIYPGTLSSLSELEELYIDVSPDDERWNQCVEVIVSELSKLFSLKDLCLYVARTEFLRCFEWKQLVHFDLKVGHDAKRLMPRLPSDAEIELQKYGRRLTYVNGEGESKEINLLLEFTEALFLDRHATIYALSQFEGFNSLICCVAGECNQLQVLFHGDQMTHVLLEYLHIYYMKSLKSIWEGVIIPHALSHLKSLTLRTCPELTTVFTPALIAGLESLEELTMVDCPAVTNLVSTNDFKHITFLNEPFIPTLKRISLHDLPELTAIFDLYLSPNLSWISIYHCPNLKSLPIDKVKNVDLKKIEGEMNWWKALEGGKIHQQHPWRDVFKEIVDCPVVTNFVSTNDFKRITFLNEPFISRLKRISLHDLPKLTILEGRKIHQQHPLTARLERLSLHDLLKLTALEGGGIRQQHSLTALEGAEIHQQHPLTALEGGKSINSIHEEATAIDRLKALEGGKSSNSIHEEATTSIERMGKSFSIFIDKLIDSENEKDFTLWHEERQGVVSPYPDRPGAADCLYYLRTGVCRFGSNCRFNHPPYSAQGTQYREELPERVGQPDCGYYLKTGTCKFGSTCKFHHPRDRNGAGPVPFNVLGLPMRQDEKPCYFYMRTGACKFGVACKFNHPQPASFGTSLPITAPTVSSAAPSSGLPCVGGLPAWSLPRAPCMSGPQTYMPVVVSPSQGVVAAKGWNSSSASSAQSLATKTKSSKNLCERMPTALGLRRDNHHLLRPMDSTHHHQTLSSSSSSPSSMDLHLHLQSFQNQIAQRLRDLDTQDFLSLSWIRRLLLSFLCSHEDFTLILSNYPNPPPLLDRFIQDYYDRSLKALDVCNAVRNGIDHIRDWKKLLEIVVCALDNNRHNHRLLGEGNFRRAKKALIDLSISMLDGKDSSAAALSAHRNRSFGRQNGSSTRDHNRHFRSLSWSVSRSWSAAKQVLAIGSNLVAPKPSEVIATGGIAAAVFTMNSFLLFVMWVLVAAIPCQDRGLQVHFSIPRQFEWAAPMLLLHDKILEESRKRERRNSCGLLREIYQMDKCVRGMNELADSVQFPLTEEKEGEVRRRVEELRQVYDEISEGLDPLERQVRQVFHRIVQSRTEGLDSMGRHNNHSE